MNLSGGEHKYSIHSRDRSSQSLREEEPNTKEQRLQTKREGDGSEYLVQPGLFQHI